MKDELASQDDSADLALLISLCNRLDNCLHAQWRESTLSSFKSREFTLVNQAPVPSFPPIVQSTDEPMQLGRAHLSQEERVRRRQAGECFYCGQSVISSPHVLFT